MNSPKSKQTLASTETFLQMLATQVEITCTECERRLMSVDVQHAHARDELRDELREEVLEELRDDLYDEVVQELRDVMREELRDEVRDELWEGSMLPELRDELLEQCADARPYFHAVMLLIDHHKSMGCGGVDLLPDAIHEVAPTTVTTDVHCGKFIIPMLVELGYDVTQIAATPATSAVIHVSWGDTEKSQ